MPTMVPEIKMFTWAQTVDLSDAEMNNISFVYFTSQMPKDQQKLTVLQGILAIKRVI